MLTRASVDSLPCIGLPPIPRHGRRAFCHDRLFELCVEADMRAEEAVDDAFAVASFYACGGARLRG
jgi:hypothetical protein